MENSCRHHFGTTSVFEVVKQVPGSFRCEIVSLIDGHKDLK